MNREYSETEKAAFKRQYKKLCWHLKLVNIIVVILVLAVALLALMAASNRYLLNFFLYPEKTIFIFAFCLIFIFALIINHFINRCPACKKLLRVQPSRHVKFCPYCGIGLLQ